MPLTRASLALMLGLFWLLLSGHGSALLLGLGAASVLLVMVILRRMSRIDGLPYPMRAVTPALVGYWVWLSWQVLKANVAVVWCIWHPALPIAPVRLSVPLPQRTLFGRALYANSITLTPGTVTIRVRRGELEVHALNAAFAADLVEGEMARRVCRLER